MTTNGDYQLFLLRRELARLGIEKIRIQGWAVVEDEGEIIDDWPTTDRFVPAGEVETFSMPTDISRYSRAFKARALQLVDGDIAKYERLRAERERLLRRR